MSEKQKKAARKANRRVAAGNLFFLGTMMVKVNHELGKLANIEILSGLTPVERQFLRKRVDILEKTSDEIRKLRERLENVPLDL